MHNISIWRRFWNRLKDVVDDARYERKVTDLEAKLHCNSGANGGINTILDWRRELNTLENWRVGFRLCIIFVPVIISTVALGVSIIALVN